MARLYSDLIDGSGRRYYFLLESAPGGISATNGFIRVLGWEPVIQSLETVFRTPTTATLTLRGISFVAEVPLVPATAALSMVGQIPAEQRLQIITNAFPPDYSTPPALAPTIIFVNTISPTTGLVRITNLEQNLTQGGNILIVLPAAATLTISGYLVSLPHIFDIGTIVASGLPPTLATELIVSPEIGGGLTINGLPGTLSVPFRWNDDNPVPPTTWLDDPPP